MPETLSLTVANRDRPRYTFSLPPEIMDKLRELSRQTGVPQSRIIERAIVRFLRSVEDDPAELLKD